MKHLFVHRLDYSNPGDLWSTPMHYLPKTFQGAVVDVFRLNHIRDWNIDTIILGGGSLMHNQDDLHNFVRFLGNNDYQNLVVWGVGIDIANNLHKLRSRCDMFGIREYDARYSNNWVPCASVMSPLFARLRGTQPSKDILIIDHWKRKPIATDRECTRIVNRPMNIEVMLNMIADHRWVVTSSYHGVYWATVMNRRVIFCSRPWVPKVMHMKHPPWISKQFCDNDLDASLAYPEAYHECLGRNLAFRQEFFELTSP